MSSIKAPPEILDSAKVICYAINDEKVQFTDRITLLVGQERGNLHKLTEQPCLAIAKNEWEEIDYLLMFCTAEWEVLGVIGLDSVEAAKEKAESGYRGIYQCWVDMPT